MARSKSTPRKVTRVSYLAIRAATSELVDPRENTETSLPEDPTQPPRFIEQEVPDRTHRCNIPDLNAIVQDPQPPVDDRPVALVIDPPDAGDPEEPATTVATTPKLRWKRDYRSAEPPPPTTGPEQLPAPKRRRRRVEKSTSPRVLALCEGIASGTKSLEREPDPESKSEPAEPVATGKKKAKKRTKATAVATSDPGPAPVGQDEKGQFFIVSQIVKKRIDKKTGEPRWLVHWEGYPESERTWEPRENLENVWDMVEAFEGGG
jgi:hypothetical protein